MPTFDTDLYGWAMEQSELLRAGRLSDVDAETLAEEIESIARSEKRELVHRLTVLLAHMLQWQAQPGRRGKSWRLTIEEQREQLRLLLKENPGLTSRLEDAFGHSYRSAVRAAVRETDLEPSAFPAGNPWSQAQVMDDGFYPG